MNLFSMKAKLEKITKVFFPIHNLCWYHFGMQKVLRHNLLATVPFLTLHFPITFFWLSKQYSSLGGLDYSHE